MVVEYIGYGGGRGLPTWLLAWPRPGYAHLRHGHARTGLRLAPGDTADIDPDGFEPQVPGLMTRGILDPARYFYRRVFTDAARAVAAARAHPAIDPERVVVAGGSQGGGITLAAAALDGSVAAACIDVPFLCHFRRAATITDDAPYGEIGAYLKIHRDRVDQVFRTLSYIDGMNLASRATAPALFSVGLMDDDLPAVHGVRGLQPLRRPQGHPRLGVQRPRGGHPAAGPRADPVRRLAGHPPARGASPWPDRREPVGDGRCIRDDAGAIPARFHESAKEPTLFKVGLQLPWFDWPGSTDADLRSAVRAAAIGAEAAGFASLWVMDHLYALEFDSPPFPRPGAIDDPMLEAYSVLSYCAAVTERITLGPLVAAPFYRHPAMLVKVATALDVLSGGRSYFSVGAGWNRRESEGLGIPYPDQDERYLLLEETIEIALHLWSGDRSPFRGPRHTLAEPINRPQPLRRPHPPILIGGSGERRTLPLVARYADACNLDFGIGPPDYDAALGELRHKLGVLRGQCESIGRDPAEIEVTALGSIHLAPDAMSAQQVVDVLGRVREAGVDHAIVNMPNAFEPEVLERLGAEVLARLPDREAAPG